MTFGKPERPVLSIAASIVLGSVALMSLGAQPLLYGGYAHEGVIAQSQLGLLGSIEVLAIALSSAAGIAAVRHYPVRYLAIAGVAILAAGNMLRLGPNHDLLAMGARFGCGIGSGLMTGVTAAAIARTRKVGGWSAAFLFGQAISQFALVEAFSVFNPAPDSFDVQLALSGLAIATLLIVPFLPRLAGPVMDDESALGTKVSAHAKTALLGTLLYTGAVIGFWGYAGVWLESRGLTAAAATELLGLCLAGQAAGALLAIVLADRQGAALRFTMLLAAQAAIALCWLASPSSVVAAVGFGVAWMSVAPTFARLILDLDPSRRAVALVAPAQLAGIALVPSMLGLWLGEGALDRLMGVFAIMLATGLLSALPYALTKRAPHPEPA